MLEDAAIRPARDYYDVKITIAESEIYAVHERKLRAARAISGRISSAARLPAVLIRASDYVQAQRERRIMLAEMEPLYAKYDVLLTAGPAPLPRSMPGARSPSGRSPISRRRSTLPQGRLDAVHRLQPRGAAAVDADRRQAVRRDDRAARRSAYERATSWRARRPRLDGSTPIPPSAACSQPPRPTSRSPARRDRALCARAGLS